MDDDPSIVAIVSEILTAEGQMRTPVLDGWGFARELRVSPKRSPTVVMTAAENARRWAEEIRAAGYLAKPFEIDALIAAVERHATGTR